MNILFTSVGRRYYIIDYFKKNLNKKTKIVSINSSIYSSAKNNSNFFYKSPEIQSKSYIKFVSSIIKKHKIKVVIPLIDIDSKKLSKNISIINKLNAILISPPYEIVNIILDKYKLYKFLKKNEFFTPKTYISKNDFLFDLRKKKIKFPIMLKPRYGTSSILTIKAKNTTELNLFYKYLMKKIQYQYFNKRNHKKKIVIQECIEGTEYGLDLLNSIGKNYHSHLLKEKIKMRNGETDICKISNRNISTMCKKISELILHNFLVDIDMIEMSKKFYIIDINPRIGGGYPFTHTAGFDMVKYLLNQIYFKKKIKLPSIDSTGILMKDIHISKVNL
tara:strand:+ start:1840 stop:2838 length:999 start_codon:yes stop_codon:yes gene_type:complete